MNRQSGFTLIEMLVALTIFGLLAAAGVSLLGGSVRTQGAVAKKLDALSDEQRFGTLMAMDLAQALPRVSRGPDGGNRPAFETGRGGLLFAVTRASGSGVERVEWRFERGRISRAIAAMPDGAVTGEGAVLAENVAAPALRFRDKGNWRDRWDATRPDAMPQAVEITVLPQSGLPLRRLFLVGPGR